MANKLYGANVDYLVEGAGKKGYHKNSNKGFSDGKTSFPIKDFNSGYQSPESWFEGKKSSVGFTRNK